MKNAKYAEGFYLHSVPDRNWQIKGFNDFSGDRRPDILWQNEQTGEVGYWEIRDFKNVNGRLIQTGLIGSKDWRIVSPRDRLVDPTPILFPPSGTITGNQWNDFNGDGIRDANEPELPGWTVYLDSNQNGKLDAGEQSTLTDAEGNYRFFNLPVERYTVAVAPPADWELTAPKLPAKNTLPSQTVTVTAGSVVRVNFGARRLATAPPKAIVTTEQFGTIGNDEVRSFAIDAAGNRYLTGFTTGDLAGKNSGQQDAWVAKYDRQGTLLWMRQFGTAFEDQSRDIAIDAAGNVYLTGWTKGSLAASNPRNSSQIWAAKYDGNGNQLWMRQFNQSIESYDVALDQAGNVYLSIASQPSGSSLVKLDTNGTLIWNLPNQQWHTGSIVDQTGIYASGIISPLSKYDNQGNLLWSLPGRPGDLATHDVTLDKAGNVYVVGRTGIWRSGASTDDVWLAKYDSNGNQLWMRQLASDAQDFAEVVIVDRLGNVFVGGYTAGLLGKQKFGQLDAYIAKYDANGQILWVDQFGTDQNDGVSGLQIDETGKIYVSGWTDGVLGKQSAGSRDAWLRIINSNGV